MNLSCISIEYVDIDRLVPYSRNARRNDPVIDRMVASIREFGFAIPILAKRDGVIIDGHLRHKAARKSGISSVPVIWCDGWTEAQVKAFRLMANRSVAWAEWDLELLKLEIGDLSGLGYDLNLTGFDAKEIAALQIPVGTGWTDEDAVPEKASEPVSKLGDTWRMGPHKLACADATSAADVARLLNAVEPQLMVTDPPYGVDYQPKWRNIAFGEANRSTGTVVNDHRADWRAAWKLFPGSVVYVWHAGTKAAIVADSLEASDFLVRAQIIWNKPRFVISRGHYHVQHEPCWYAVRKGAAGHWQGDRRQTTVWDIGNGLSQCGPRQPENVLTGHGTQKPVECMRRPILNHTKAGEAVYDPFVGSGTTIIAAETTGRVALAIDVDSGYVDVAIRRWQNFTGRKAMLEGTELTFDQLAQK